MDHGGNNCTELEQECICPICHDVFDNPVQINLCEHVFCYNCILEWLKHKDICPIDRTQVTTSNLRKIPRIYRTLLSNLNRKCNYAALGCETTVNISNIRSHDAVCEYNPKNHLPCKQGCGISFPKSKLKEHNCATELCKLIDEQQRDIKEMTESLRHRRRAHRQLKSNLYSSPSNNLEVRILVEEMKRDEVKRWGSTLEKISITCWKHIIPNPDRESQARMKIALMDSGCPQHSLEMLVLCSHETNWPYGLSQARLYNRDGPVYDQYVCRRIPAKHTNVRGVLVFAFDNESVRNLYTLEPGFVMLMNGRIH